MYTFGCSREGWSWRGGGGGGGGDNSRIKCPDVCVGGLKSGPILKDIFCQKTLKGSSALFIAVL